MSDERRRSRRFLLNLSISRVNIHGISGKVLNFSRRGMKVLLDTSEFNDKEIEVYVERPDYNQQVPITASVVWSKPVEGKTLIGLNFKSIPISAKADFLKYAYSWQTKKLGN